MDSCSRERKMIAVNLQATFLECRNRVRNAKPFALSASRSLHQALTSTSPPFVTIFSRSLSNPYELTRRSCRRKDGIVFSHCSNCCKTLIELVLDGGNRPGLDTEQGQERQTGST